MLELFFYPSPNGLKATIMLEECGLPYRIRFVNILRGEQFDPEYLALNPNNKIPSLIDLQAGPEPLRIFESGAILMYLAEKSGRFLLTDVYGRYGVTQWLFWQVGSLGPMGGQAHHFRAFASEVVPYAIRRYTDEMNRIYGVLDRQLAGREYIAASIRLRTWQYGPGSCPMSGRGRSSRIFPTSHAGSRRCGGARRYSAPMKSATRKPPTPRPINIYTGKRPRAWIGSGRPANDRDLPPPLRCLAFQPEGAAHARHQGRSSGSRC